MFNSEVSRLQVWLVRIHLTWRRLVLLILLGIAAVLGVVGLGHSAAQAGTCPGTATAVWTGAAGDGVWSNGGNWSPTAVPTSASVVCLPSDVPGPASVAVPSVTLNQFVTFRPVTITAGFNTTSGADFEADSTWQGPAITGNVQIGPGVTVNVSAASIVSGSVANAGTIVVSALWQFNWGTLTNSGIVRLVDGGKIHSYQYQPAQSQWVFINSGLVEFADSSGTSIDARNPNYGYGYGYGGRFVNLALGVVSKTGSAAVDLVFMYSQGENDGTVTSSGGVLSWTGSANVQTPLVPGSDGYSDGVFTTTGSGRLGLGALVSAAATYGPNVWVTANLTGTVTLPAGTTLHVGNDPATTAAEVGTFYATTTGAGTLHITSGGTAAIDLAVASVQMDAGSSIARKPDQTATVISADTTVTLSGTPSLGSGLSLINNGVLDFGANGYFTCTNCAVTNANDLIVANPDGMPTHIFDVSKGTFVNSGTIVETGYYPAVSLYFGLNNSAGQVVMHNMSQSPWVQSVRNNQLTQILNALTPNFLGSLAALLHQQSMTMGFGACGDVTYAAGIGVTASVCLVLGPGSKEALAITLGANVGANGGFTGTVGDYVLWRTGAAGETTFDAYVDMDGPFVCQAASYDYGGGVAAQHCWGPANDVPFDLNDPLLAVTTPGVHTGYIGGGFGISAGASMGVSYTITVSCTTFTNLTWHQCPPINTAAPTISGTAALGQTLTSSTGDWNPRLPDSLTYQWRRCTTSSPSSCSNISGATTSQYVVTSVDQGRYLAVYVVGNNDGTQLTSSQSGLVYVPTG